MSWFQALILGIVEGLTEFLPVSSTGHLTIAESLLGFAVDDPSVTAFTAIVQVGAVVATLIYFRHDLWRIVAALARGLGHAEQRRAPDFRFSLAVVAGSLPICIVGFVLKDQVETNLRSLWFVGLALVGWSAVMWLADHRARQTLHEGDVRMSDTLIVGLVQCVSLIPGVSRSGATTSAGMFRGLDRVTATRLSFFLAIPALLAAGGLQAITEYDAIAQGVGWGATLLATGTSFAVAYAAIAWLLAFVAKHSYFVFIVYRVIAGLTLLTLLATGTVSAT